VSASSSAAGGSRANIEAGKRAALQRYADEHGMTLAQLEHLRAEMLRRNGGLLDRTARAV